jgi:hypothetical protein
MEIENVNDENVNDESVEAKDAEKLLEHIHPTLREIIPEPSKAGDIISRGEDGNLAIVSDLFQLASDSRVPDWKDWQFGTCRLRRGSVRYSLEDEEYVLDLVPARPRMVEVTMYNEEKGYYQARRKERFITVIATQVKPDGRGVARTQTDQWAKGLIRDRRDEADKAAKAVERASGEAKRKRKGRVVTSATVNGELVSEINGNLIEVYRMGGGPVPEATFAKNPEGFQARNAYLKEHAFAAPEPTNDDETTEA